MKSVFALASNDYRELLVQTAARMRVQPAIVEKDNWVCTVLERIFTDSIYKNHFVFKGGTSLSKVYKVIRRFSEDIDLILDWRLLGYGASKDSSDLMKTSRNQQDRLNQKIDRQASTFIKGTLLPWIESSLGDLPTVEVVQPRENPLAVEVRYPGFFATGYVADRILLEFGPLAAWIPSDWRAISPYVSEEFPQVVGDIQIPVRVTSIERTFWEKATILHQQAHRPGEIPPPYSRHYYDLYMMAKTDTATRALSDLLLLREVVEFKSRFYPSRTARYDLATPGTLRLLPDADKLSSLKRDYEQMQVMIFGSPPEWDEIVDSLGRLQEPIDTISRDSE